MTKPVFCHVNSVGEFANCLRPDRELAEDVVWEMSFSLTFQVRFYSRGRHAFGKDDGATLHSPIHQHLADVDI